MLFQNVSKHVNFFRTWNIWKELKRRPELSSPERSWTNRSHSVRSARSTQPMDPPDWSQGAECRFFIYISLPISPIFLRQTSFTYMTHMILILWRHMKSCDMISLQSHSLPGSRKHWILNVSYNWGNAWRHTSFTRAYRLFPNTAFETCNGPPEKWLCYNNTIENDKPR